MNIVCDAPVALLALYGAVELTPETLFTTTGQWFEVVKGLNHLAIGGDPDDVPDYLSYLHTIEPMVVSRLAEVAAVPPSGLLHIHDTSGLVNRAVELACDFGLTADVAFLFAAAEDLTASVLYSQNHGENPGVFTELGSRLGIDVECLDERAALVLPPPGRPQDKLRMSPARVDRRRPMRRVVPHGN